MKLEITKEQCKRLAELEGDNEIGAGFSLDPVFALVDDISKILEGHAFALRAGKHHRSVAIEIITKIVSG